MAVSFRPSPVLFPFESRWFASAAGRIHYIDEGTGPPILMFHGNPTWCFLYRKLVVRLRDRFRCVAPDYPGFGLSERPAGYGYTPAEHAATVGELVRHLDLRNMIIFGQDWGGPIGIAVGVGAADRVRGLVLGNTWLRPFARPRDRLMSRFVASAPGNWLVREKNWFLRQFPMLTAARLSKEELEHYRAVQPTPQARVGVAEFPRQLVQARGWMNEVADAVPATLADRSVLLVWGMRDWALRPHVFVPGLREAFPRSVLVELPRAKHYIQEDAPDEIAKAIVEQFG